MSISTTFMFSEPSIWITVATVMTLVSTVYLGFAEIIGNHLQYSKFTNSGPNKQKGMKLSSRTGMLILYMPAFLAGVVSFFVFPGEDIRFLLLKFAVNFYFFKRDFEILLGKYAERLLSGGFVESIKSR